MADYKTMYNKLLIEMCETVDRFQKKIHEVEDIYIDTDNSETRVDCLKEESNNNESK